MEIVARQEKNALVVTVSGRLDAVTSPEYEQRMSALVSAGATHVVADFEALDYISSAGLRSILIAGKQVMAAGKQFRFAHVHGPVKEVFHISGFTGLFPIDESVADALKALA